LPLDRDLGTARRRARDRAHPGQIDPGPAQRREHELGRGVVPDGAGVGRAQPEPRTRQHGRRHLAARQLERLRRLGVCGRAGGCVDEDHPVERVLADPEDVEAPRRRGLRPEREGRPERIGLGPGVQYSTR
jgi:hypothetical protein